MDILVPHSWLKDYLDTDAQPAQIAKCLSLCGPSVERIDKLPDDSIYHIEVTTNRVDSASVAGIAREAAAILPRFGYRAKLLPQSPQSRFTFSKKVSYLTASVDSRLAPRFSAILIRDVTLGPSPAWLRDRLTKVGLRSLNNVVDISNYVMHALGQPVHTFDYDKIAGHKMVLRASKPKEKITTLDGKTHTLPGGDIVIEDSSGKLIDLAGIMGGQSSAVDQHTKNVLLFVQTYNPAHIRKTSMTLAARTQAAVLFEKGLDSALVVPAITFALDLFVKHCKGTPESVALDIYTAPPKPTKISVSTEQINRLLGTQIKPAEMVSILVSLGFEAKLTGNQLNVVAPSARASDVTIWQDVAEEIARLFGYHNMDSVVMQGSIPPLQADSPFMFERLVKGILKGYGGSEVYTLSLVSPDMAGRGALKLTNPLGSDYQYLRTSLAPSLVSAAQANRGRYDQFHLFEMANTYSPVRGDLPKESMTIAGIVSGLDFRHAKGIIEALCEELHIALSVHADEHNDFPTTNTAVFMAGKTTLGYMGSVVNGLMYYQLDMLKLHREAHLFDTYQPIPKYPAQIEDLSLVVPDRTHIGDVIAYIVSQTNFHIRRAELIDIFDNSFTFRLWYQEHNRTLSDKDVEGFRKLLLAALSTKFGIHHKD